MFEVEKRVFLDKNIYENLKKEFSEKGQLLKNFKRFTLVSVGRKDFIPSKEDPVDIRIRSTGKDSELTLKYGNWFQDSAREEYELKFTTDQFSTILSMLKILGYKYFMATYIERFKYSVDEMIITLDQYFTSTKKTLMEVEIEVPAKEEVPIAEKKIDEFIVINNLKAIDGEEFLEFVNEMNRNKSTQIDLDDKSVDEVINEWKDFIECKVN